MYQKFIITGDGHLRFGRVYLHRDLLKSGEKCVYGGGLWLLSSVRLNGYEDEQCVKNIDEGCGAIILYGRSFDFGPPDFDYVKVIEWETLDGNPHSLFHQPHWPNDETLIPVYAKP